MTASARAASKHPEALTRELWGWYMYDFANSAFFQSAGTVRFLFPSPRKK
jgi:MFS-type transporter involved in bile tolerance (Atg22 family)